MYYRDHNPPHFHAKYGEYEATFDLLSSELLTGRLPERANRLVQTWAIKYRMELQSNWLLALLNQPLQRIEPLE